MNEELKTSQTVADEIVKVRKKYIAKPLTKNGKCILCDADVVIHISKYNGHKRFHCNKFGCYVME